MSHINLMSNPAQPLTIQKIKRSNRKLFIAYTKGGEELTVDSPDNPLPEFLTAMAHLVEILGDVLHVPTTWTGENCRIVGMNLGEQGGAETVSILAQKSLPDAGKAFKIVTPPRLLSHPVEPGSYTSPLTEAQAQWVHELIEQAKQYVLGNRAQGVLPGLNPDEDDDTDFSDEAPDLQALKFEVAEAAEEPAKKKRGRPKKVTATA